MCRLFAGSCYSRIDQWRLRKQCRDPSCDPRSKFRREHWRYRWESRWNCSTSIDNANHYVSWKSQCAHLPRYQHADKLTSELHLASRISPDHLNDRCRFLQNLGRCLRCSVSRHLDKDLERPVYYHSDLHGDCHNYYNDDRNVKRFRRSWSRRYRYV